MTSQSGRTRLRAVDLSKSFGGVHAVRGVTFEVRAGTCHAVVGENGAGKSTLMRMLSGELAPTSGEIHIDGRPIHGGVHAAQSAGVAMMHQELSLVPHLTVAENVVLGAAPTRLGFILRKAQRQFALNALARAGLELNPDAEVGTLPLAARQFVELAKALHRDPKVLILDEPTASLTPKESDTLHELLQNLAADGMSIVYISHRIQDVLSFCTTVSVLRDGSKVGEVEASDTSSDALVSMMVGGELDLTNTQKSETRTPGEVVLRATGITTPVVTNASLELRRGEILGLGGVVGAGRSEWVRALIGLDPRTAGTTEIATADGFTEIRNYQQALAAGVAYVPEDRREEGLSLEMTVEENLALPNVVSISRGRIVNVRRKNDMVDSVIRSTRIKTSSSRSPASSLSGGNQQKIVFGKWLPRDPKIIVLDEPTRGVDVGAKAEIHRMIQRLADAGAAVLLISSDLPELLSMSDRIIVLSRGEIAGSLEDNATADAVIRLATVAQPSVTKGAVSYV